MTLRIVESESDQIIRMWKIDKNKPNEIHKTTIPLEENLEDWLENDISMISDNLLVIGRQVPTAYRGFIDLLCIDDQGNLIIIELKRDKTPRDITAQTIDYASWIQEITANDVIQLAEDYFREKSLETSLEEAYIEKFQIDFPDIIKDDHRMIVVGSNIDTSTQRIINYLNERGIGINAYTFNYFEENGNSYIASTYLIEPIKAEASRRRKRQVSTIWTQPLEEMTRKFHETIPEPKIGKTAPSHKKIFSDYPSIHYEFLIMGQPDKKSVNTSLHLEKKDREENMMIFKKLLPKIKEFEMLIPDDVYYGSWDPKKDHKWKTVSISREFGDIISDKDIEWAVNRMITLHRFFNPLLSEVLS